MVKSDIPYNIGLDIGTSSVGWAATDDKNKLIHLKGHNAIGVRLFKEGESASERRGFRTTRRRLSRRKWRLRLLNEIFDEHIAKVDPSFFARMKQSNVSPLDKNHKRSEFNGNILFNDKDFDDKEFHKEYRTIYHLRKALMTEDEKFDIRLIYLAMHHIIKYRGHFLNKANVQDFKGGKVDLNKSFSELNEEFKNQGRTILLKDKDLDNDKKTLLDNSRSRSDRARELTKSLYISDVENDKDQVKLNQKTISNILKAILGMNAQFNVILGLDVDDDKEWKLNFNSDEFDDKISGLDSQMTDQSRAELMILKKLYFSINLSDILNDAETGKTASSLSDAMIARFNDHKKHLKLLKIVADQEDETKPKKAKALRQAYADYINGIDGKPVSVDDFYKTVKKNLNDSEESKEILEDIDTRFYFMPKQRSKENGAVPHQLQQQELDMIIENQKKYYPWLAELNPNKSRKKEAKYKLSELVAFRVPYYVGPMIDPNESTNNQNGKFAWMKRKEKGSITPWNFDQKVDVVESANKFIKRMTTTDTYLIGEPVLPKNSLLYQKFTVLNELNKLKVNKKPITLEQKQYIFENVYKNNKRVSLKKIGETLRINDKYSSTPEVTGTTDQRNANNSLSSYIDMKNIFGGKIDDPGLQNDFEKIIEWSTIFEDKNIYSKKLDELGWISDDEKKKLLELRYQGWGRLSAKLLANDNNVDKDNVNILNSKGERIIDDLWNTNFNFMEIISDKSFKKAIDDFNGEHLEKEDVNEVIDNLYTSPQNKKAIRQIILVTDDIIKAHGGVHPQNIMMEFARDNSNDHRLKQSRSRQLDETYKKITDNWFDDAKQELKEKIADKAEFKDKLYLYFVQGGHDLYDGKPLDIDNLSGYEIDHILPQSFILDNSLDNRVLTKKENNSVIKEDNLPGEFFGSKMKSTWNVLRDQGLMSWKKYNNLMMKPSEISKHDNKIRFINRQLVETRQVIKLAAEIMNNLYCKNDQNDHDTHIVTVKANLTHHMRQKFNFYKNRNVNDYHHAFDAYLTVFVGNWLLKTYPSLAPFYVYGDFTKGDVSGLKTFNMLYKFENGHTLNEDGSINKDNDKMLGYMKDVYHFKKMLTTKELETKHGALYKQTLFASPTHGKNRKLINAKDNRPSEIYGGYSAETNAFMALVKIKKNRGDEYRMYGIPLREYSKMKNKEIESGKVDKEAVEEIITKQLTNSKGKCPEHRVLLPKVEINQLVDDGENIYTMSSNEYKQTASQLVLSDRTMKTLSNNYKNMDDEDLNLAFKEIIKSTVSFIPMFKIENQDEVITKFNQIEDKKEKYNLIANLLASLHANPTINDLSLLGLSKYLGMFVMTSGLTVNSVASFVYQSPTGLFSRRVKISEL